MGNTFEKLASIACNFAVEVLAIPRKKSVSRAVSPGFCTRLVGSWRGVQIVPGTETTENMTTSLDIAKSNLRIQK